MLKELALHVCGSVKQPNRAFDTCFSAFVINAMTSPNDCITGYKWLAVMCYKGR